ncbi:hypothetical protein BH24PSE2_BH24PSE2_20720 [soil metagenome]
MRGHHGRTGREPVLIAAISLFAVSNGALVQIMMASRALYGMGAKGLGLEVFATVSPRTQTPLATTAAVTAVVLALALWLPLVTLAEITSFLILLVFALVNLSLRRLKRRAPQPERVPDYPRWVAGCGTALCSQHCNGGCSCARESSGAYRTPPHDAILGA